MSIVKQYAAMARYKKSHIYLSIIYLSIYPPAFPSISHTPTLILRVSLIPFLILAFTESLLSLKSLRICLRKIVALVQKRMLLFHNSRYQIIVYKNYDVISVITKIHFPYSVSSKRSIICEV